MRAPCFWAKNFKVINMFKKMPLEKNGLNGFNVLFILLYGLSLNLIGKNHLLFP
jgi:hypothetical protein